MTPMRSLGDDFLEKLKSNLFASFYTSRPDGSNISDSSFMQFMLLFSCQFIPTSAPFRVSVARMDL
jgi:hypothetical protein